MDVGMWIKNLNLLGMGMGMEIEIRNENWEGESKLLPIYDSVPSLPTNLQIPNINQITKIASL